MQLSGIDLGDRLAATAGVIDWSQVITAEAKAQAAAEQLLVTVSADLAQRRAVADAAIAPLQDAVELEEATESARQKLELAQGRAAAAESAAGGLRGEIARLRAGRAATCDTIATQRRQAGTSAVVVLRRLLEDADRMAGSLAEALERSRIAGLACESVVDRMKVR